MSAFLLIDSLNLFYRSLYAPRALELTAPDGRPTSGVFGFYRSLRSVLEDCPYTVTHAAVCFDPRRETLLKRKIDGSYKDGRSAKTGDITWQIAQCRELCRNMRIKTICAKGYEADDVIASIVRNGPQGVKKVIVSGDHDLHQLVVDDTVMYDPFKQVEFTYYDISNRWGVPVHQIIEVKTLTGCKTDNVRGVDGIGDKIAAKLIKQYRTADRAKQYCTNQRLYKLMQSVDLKKVRQLVSLIDTVRVSSELDDYVVDATKLLTIPAKKQLEALGFRKSIER